MAHDPIDSYPLSPMQRGMVADHPLNANTGLDSIQYDCVFEADLDLDAFRAAWEWAVARHDALRTCFRWTADGRLTQDLYRRVALPWSVVASDWDEFVRRDRAAGFRLDRAPLVRCAVAAGDDVTRCVFTFHHSVLDGRSMAILWREVFARYAELRGGPITELPAPPRYRDFVDWLGRRDGSADEPFWRDLLDGVRTSTVVGGIAGASVAAEHAEFDVLLPERLSDELRALAAKYDLTLNTVVQGAWAILLSRYTDQDDVVFGAVRSVRRGTVPGADNLVGLLLNTLPVRARATADQSVADFLGALRAEAVSVRDHQHTPLMDWRRWTDLPGGESLFDTLVVYENGSTLEGLRALDDAWAQRSMRIRRQPAYPLVLQVFADTAVLMKLVHDRARFTADAITAMGGHLRQLFESIVADPTQRVGALDLLTPAETHRVVVAWNPASSGRSAECVHDRVARRAAADPDGIALVAGARRITHGELDRWANRIAHSLSASGVGRDQVVAVAADPSPELIAGQLGVLRAGAACLPVSAQRPDLVGVEFALAGRAAMVPAGVRVLDLDGGFADAAECDPLCGAVPADLAFVLGESLIPHVAVDGLLAQGLTADDRVALWASPSYEASLFEVWPALVAGASLHVPDREPDAEWLADNGITVAFLPGASAGRMIARLVDSPGALRMVTVVGRVFDGPVSDCPFEVRYVAGPDSGVEAGRPRKDTEVYVLDHGGRPVPPGVAGELCVAGGCLARGIAGRAALTAEHFRPHPFGRTPGARIHHSGIAARHTPDGALELLGPVGSGVRFAPARVEAAVRRQPSVADAAVLVTNTDRGAAQVAVFATPRSGALPMDEIREIRRTVADLLAVPVVVHAVSDLPATATGRVDSGALVAGTDVVVTVPAEHRLAGLVADVWADVLDCDDASRAALRGGTADFFELGGHSMFAITVALRLSRELDASIPARLVFEASTVPAFLARLDDLLRDEASTSRITPLPRD